jgi:hypothetical protein
MKLSLDLNKFIKKSGFTLVEIVVSVGIMTLILTLVMVSYPRFSEMAHLHRGSQSVITSIRRAQVYGISVKEVSAGTGQFPAYGIHFDPAPSTAYHLFADILPAGDPPGDNSYNDVAELLITYDVPAPGYIFDICAEQKQDGGCTASGSGGICGLGGADIVFRRPVPDIYLYDASGALMNPCNDMEIVVKSPRAGQRSVVIWRSGQIAVE